MNALFSVLFAAVVQVYPQSFDRGGWSLDPQFMDVMGSPYLLAHGVGERVCDAKASVAFPRAGKYRVWVRTRNWADGAPGRFKVSIDGKQLDKVFGAAQREWGWEDGGEVAVGERSEVRLCDLTGFDGRCAGIVFADDGTVPKCALRIDGADVHETVEADFVVVGGGLPGTCAALAAARRGLRTILVQDRPALGGNASAEIRVWAAGEARYPLVREVRNLFMNRDPNQALCDARRMRIVEDEKTLEVRLSTRVFAAECKDGKIVAVKALDLTSNRVIEFKAGLFCDATGDGWLGYYAGAEYRMGREGRGEFGESFAPEKGDGDTLGASIMWTSVEGNEAVAFSAPWAEPYAQGETAVNGEWNWEYGIHRDMIEEGEAIRDRLLLAIYGAFSRAKKNPKNANRVINFCPYLLGKRESRRLMGDWILSEKDITEHRHFEDAIASGSWSIDLHYDTFKPGVDFLTDCEQPHYGRYFIPYRSIYSKNVSNLFMVGRCFSCTHIGLGSPRVMNTLSQLGVAAGEAAALCSEKGVLPRAIYSQGMYRVLQERLGGGFPGVPDKATQGWIIVDDEDDGVMFGKGWTEGHNPNGEQVGHISHFAGGSHWRPNKPDGMWVADATYPVPIKQSGRYAVYGRVPWHHAMKPGSRTVLKLTGPGFSYRFEADQGLSPGTWRKLGEFRLEPGATLVIIAGESEGTVVADGFAFERLSE